MPKPITPETMPAARIMTGTETEVSLCRTTEV